MDEIEIVLAGYRFKFRRLFWEEELRLPFGEGRDPRRVVLATALMEVSGLSVSGFEEAWRVVCPEILPTSIMDRVFVIYKGKQPASREFTTRNLYKAPDPAAYGRQIDLSEEASDRKADAVVQRMEQQFGKKELADAAEIDRQIVAGSRMKDRYRGAAPRPLDPEEEEPLGGWKANHG